MNEEEKYKEAQKVVRRYEQKLKQASINCWAFNINDKILVKLKYEGFKYFLADFNKYLPDDFKVSMEELKEIQDEDGYIEFQMWEFIRIFGSTISMGSQPIFENTVRFFKNEIKNIL